MADETNQDLSMEDILSSIKDILTEDEQNQGLPATTDPVSAPLQAMEEPAGEPTVEFDLSANLASMEDVSSIAPTPEPEEEILDLSPSMRVEDKLDLSAPEIDLDDELDNINSNLDDINIDNQADLRSPFTKEEDNSSSVFNAEEDVFANIAEIHDIDSDPFDAPSTPVNENFFSEEVIEPEAVNVEQDIQPVARNMWQDENITSEDDFVEPTIPVYDKTQAEYEPQAEMPIEHFLASEPLADIEADPVFEPEYETPFEATPTYEPEPINFTEPEMMAEPAASPTKEDTVDVSASIINNFAKMFSKVEEQKAEPIVDAPVMTAAYEPVSVLGDGTKTIEGVVTDVIRQLIGGEVAQNWRQGADYDALAREEIARQTNQWLNANLPGIVEQIVKKEIERVMAKVGS